MKENEGIERNVEIKGEKRGRDRERVSILYFKQRVEKDQSNGEKIQERERWGKKK